MSASGIDPIAALRPIYRNPDRVSGETCDVCTTPVHGGWPSCYRCNENRKVGVALADVVAPLSYATKQSQAYVDVYTYKSAPATLQSAAAGARLRRLFYEGMSRHLTCLTAAGPITALASVPSSSGRLLPHPLESLLEIFAPAIHRLSLRYVGDKNADRNAKRIVNPDGFEVVGSMESIDHVLILEDSWVTGGHSQSVAAHLKRCGASRVSIVTLARVLDPSYDVTADYLNAHPRAPYDPEMCPVHGTKH